MKLLMSVGVVSALFGGTAAMAAPSFTSGATAASATITAANVVKADLSVAKVSGSAPLSYNSSANIASVNQNFLLVDGILIDAYQSLNANVISSHAFSDYPSSMSATGTTLIADAGATLYTQLLGINTLSLGVAADAIGSTTTVGANAGGLFAVASSTITDFTLTGSLFNALTVNTGLFFNPGPNTVILSLVGLRLVLNEQIQSGNGIDSLSMQTNAVHLSLKDYLFNGKLLNGDVILGRSEASISGYSPAVPEPATWAMLISGFAIVGVCMRRSKVAINFA